MVGSKKLDFFGHRLIPLKVLNGEKELMLGFRCLCCLTAQTSKMDKLGHFLKERDQSIPYLAKNDLANLMLGFRCLCLELCSVDTYIEFKFNVRYFQWYVFRRKIFRLFHQ